MLRPLLLVFVLLLVVSFIPAQDSKSQDAKSSDSKAAAKPNTPGYQPVPVTAARQVNPVKATPESIAAGKKIYTYDCALCHGATGNGKGDAPTEIKVPDITDPAVLKDRTDGELFYTIKTGRGDMPPEGDRVKAEQVWDLVNYVRTLPKKAAAEKPEADKSSN